MAAPIEKIPEHLQPYVATQDPSLYSAIDHASWRYIMRVSKRFFSKHAHSRYLEGLEETGISSERIPLVSEMDQRLRRFGWRAVAVSGFIPPAVFMEFQSLGILPIACDIRKIENLAYTPAPDIVHEAAGHAPILADAEYSAYLKSYGEVSRRAIFSSKDMDVYEAIRNLSEVKEDPESSADQIRLAQTQLERAVAAVDYTSEATYLARMNWWTVEYGLIGSLDAPLIYGAGLLSSVGESESCLKEGVLKLPFTLDCINRSYDITRPQPQLFVAPSFDSLKGALDEFSRTMAYQTGGIDGLTKALAAGTLVTALGDTGIAVSGVLSRLRSHIGAPAYLNFKGPCQISLSDREIEGQGPSRHPEGFGAPLGKIVGTSAGVSALDPSWLKRGVLEFESGVKLQGRWVRTFAPQGIPLLVTFDQCKVTLGDEVLFDPSWGQYDLLCAEKIVSVFGGAGDRAAFARSVGQQGVRKPIQKSNATGETRGLAQMYAEVRIIRETGKNTDQLRALAERVAREYPDDWLLTLEILELTGSGDLRTRLQTFALKGGAQSDATARLIQRGLEALA